MIVLPLPEKILWPNGRGHWAAKSRAFKKHREWAHIAALAELPTSREAMDLYYGGGGTVRIKYTITPKTRHKIDRDNCIAAMKAYQDGIAEALGIDDSNFATPEIEFAEPEKPGRVEVSFV